MCTGLHSISISKNNIFKWRQERKEGGGVGKITNEPHIGLRASFSVSIKKRVEPDGSEKGGKMRSGSVVCKRRPCARRPLLVSIVKSREHCWTWKHHFFFFHFLGSSRTKKGECNGHNKQEKVKRKKDLVKYWKSFHFSLSVGKNQRESKWTTKHTQKKILMVVIKRCGPRQQTSQRQNEWCTPGFAYWTNWSVQLEATGSTLFECVCVCESMWVDYDENFPLGLATISNVQRLCTAESTTRNVSKIKIQ